MFEPMNIVEIAIGELKPYERNAKKHPKAQIEKIAASIKRFGFRQPMVVDGQNAVVIGHGRLEAAKQLGMATVPCVVADDLTEQEIRELRIADNRLNESDWDEELLRLELSELDEPENTGFEGDDLAKALGKAMNGEEDDFDTEPPNIPLTKRGELWTLGEHRLLCGDSTKREDVERLMGGEKADLFLTDAPYGVSYTAKNIAVNGNVSPVSQGENEIASDEKTIEEIKPLWFASAKNAFDVSKNDASYYWFACQGGDQMMMMMMIGEAGWLVRHELIWKKSSMVFGRSDYHYQHEPIIYGWKKKGKHNWYSDRTQTSILEFDRPSKSELHPTTKPVELIAYLVGNNTKTDDVVLDLFGGSGSTLIACEQMKRKCFMCEVDPRYTDVILNRWVAQTGGDPVREDGVKWSELQTK